MLTQNADTHPIMRRMHKPDPALNPEQQDKRSVVPLQTEDVDTWLHGTPEQAAALVQLPCVELFDSACLPDQPQSLWD